MMRHMFSALAALAVVCGGAKCEASAATLAAPDPWSGEWSGAAKLASGRLVDVAVQVREDGSAELRTPGCAEPITFLRWGAPGRVYTNSGLCGAAPTFRLVIGVDQVMRMRAASRAPGQPALGALRLRAPSIAPTGTTEPTTTLSLAPPAGPVAGPVAAPAMATSLAALPIEAAPPTPVRRTPSATPVTPDGQPDLLGGPQTELNRR